MKRLFASFAFATGLMTLVISGCGQAAPSATPTRAPAVATKAVEPTKAPAAPTKAAEPTKPAAQPTVPPAKKVDFPQKGKAITFIVSTPPGGSLDVGGRLLAPLMEKELGVPVQIVNKAGAGTQVGATELSLAKPDGYTIGYTANPTTMGLYLNPERKAVFTRKSFDPVALTVVEATAWAVQSSSPHKTMKDMVDAARAKSGESKLGVSAVLGVTHLAVVMLERAAGIKFATVHFDGGAPVQTALLGGHVEVVSNTESTVLPHAQSGVVRVLGIADKQESAFFPGVKTLEAQGYKASMSSAHIISAPAGTSPEIVDILGGAVKKAMESDEIKKKYAELGLSARYMGPAQAAAYWDQLEADVRPLMEQLLTK